MTPDLQASISKTLAFDHGGPYGISEETKRDAILEYAQKYGCDILIETGTNVGNMVEAVRHKFKAVYSIELGPNLYEQCRNRFAGIANVHLICGDAGEVLWELLPELKNQKLIFYLDAHSRYDDTSPAGKGIGTSVPFEIPAIFNMHPESIVLIDDARLFTHKYNTSWPELTETIRDIEYLGVWNVDLKNDMIRLVPKAWASTE